jgi:hypothetical protein
LPIVQSTFNALSKGDGTKETVNHKRVREDRTRDCIGGKYVTITESDLSNAREQKTTVDENLNIAGNTVESNITKSVRGYENEYVRSKLRTERHNILSKTKTTSDEKYHEFENRVQNKLVSDEQLRVNIKSKDNGDALRNSYYEESVPVDSQISGEGNEGPNSDGITPIKSKKRKRSDAVLSDISIFHEKKDVKSRKIIQSTCLEEKEIGTTVISDELRDVKTDEKQNTKVTSIDTESDQYMFEHDKNEKKNGAESSNRFNVNNDPDYKKLAHIKCKQDFTENLDGSLRRSKRLLGKRSFGYINGGDLDLDVSMDEERRTETTEFDQNNGSVPMETQTDHDSFEHGGYNLRSKSSVESSFHSKLETTGIKTTDKLLSGNAVLHCVHNGTDISNEVNSLQLEKEHTQVTLETTTWNSSEDTIDRKLSEARQSRRSERIATKLQQFNVETVENPLPSLENNENNNNQRPSRKRTNVEVDNGIKIDEPLEKKAKISLGFVEGESHLSVNTATTYTSASTIISGEGHNAQTKEFFYQEDNKEVADIKVSNTIKTPLFEMKVDHSDMIIRTRSQSKEDEAFLKNGASLLLSKTGVTTASATICPAGAASLSSFVSDGVEKVADAIEEAFTGREIKRRRINHQTPKINAVQNALVSSASKMKGGLIVAGCCQIAREFCNTDPNRTFGDRAIDMGGTLTGAGAQYGAMASLGVAAAPAVLVGNEALNVYSDVVDAFKGKKTVGEATKSGLGSTAAVAAGVVTYTAAASAIASSALVTTTLPAVSTAVCTTLLPALGTAGGAMLSSALVAIAPIVGASLAMFTVAVVVKKVFSGFWWLLFGESDQQQFQRLCQELEIRPESTYGEIRRQFLTELRKNHPDKNKGENGEKCRDLIDKFRLAMELRNKISKTDTVYKRFMRLLELMLEGKTDEDEEENEDE